MQIRIMKPIPVDGGEMFKLRNGCSSLIWVDKSIFSESNSLCKHLKTSEPELSLSAVMLCALRDGVECI